MLNDLDSSARQLLGAVVTAHLPDWEDADPHASLRALSDHARSGCKCDPEAIRTSLEPLRTHELPAPEAMPRSLTVAMISVVDDGLYVLTNRQLKGEGLTWAMPDLISASAVAFCIVNPTNMTVQKGKSDLVASLLLGWQGAGVDLVKIDGEYWEGPFPEEPEGYAIRSFYFDGDYSAPAGGGTVSLVKLVGKYWSCLDITGEKTWDPMRAISRAEALAEFREGFEEVDDDYGLRE